MLQGTPLSGNGSHVNIFNGEWAGTSRQRLNQQFWQNGLQAGDLKANPTILHNVAICLKICQLQHATCNLCFVPMTGELPFSSVQLQSSKIYKTNGSSVQYCGHVT